MKTIIEYLRDAEPQGTYILLTVKQRDELVKTYDKVSELLEHLKTLK